MKRSTLCYVIGLSCLLFVASMQAANGGTLIGDTVTANVSNYSPSNVTVTNNVEFPNNWDGRFSMDIGDSYARLTILSEADYGNHMSWGVSDLDWASGYRLAAVSVDTNKSPSVFDVASYVTFGDDWVSSELAHSSVIRWNPNDYIQLNLTFAPVPEPGTMSLMIGAGVCICAYARRRFKAAT